ncbi:MAG: peroxiredoxin [Alphaproteobacteria bacterium]|nr:peroxiredoxin [Alphaproteobacteria bacterium]
MTTLETLPPDLPVPEDDGACDHMTGLSLPAVSLAATSGENTALDGLTGLCVFYVYPMTGRPGTPLPPGWDQIPGARGCTPQACAFRDHMAELEALRCGVFGISAQSPDDQKEARERLNLPYHLLSDAGLEFAAALNLPTFEVAGLRLIKRLTLVASDGVIEKVFYPVFPPDGNAARVIAWLRARG